MTRLQAAEAPLRPDRPGEQLLVTWRNELGETTRLWSGSGGGRHGRHWVGEGRFLAFSGAGAVDYNLVLVHGGDRRLLVESIEDVAALRRPAIVVVAGAALGAVSLLADAGYVCIGGEPFMRLALGSESSDPGEEVELLDSSGIAELRALVGAAFALPPELTELALPDSSATGHPGHDPAFALFGLRHGGRLVSGTALVRAGTTVCVWSMATEPDLQGQGYGRRLLAGALARASAAGCRDCLLVASPAGERLYRSVGFGTVEHWQLWTRPRWVLA